LALDYYNKLEKERGFIYCDMDALRENEIERRTPLGCELADLSKNQV